MSRANFHYNVRTLYGSLKLYGGEVHLRELITQKQVNVIVPSGYMGNQGEIWFARIMPEPFAKLNYGYSVVFTTPYIISEMRNERYVFSSEKMGLLKIVDTPNSQVV